MKNKLLFSMLSAAALSVGLLFTDAASQAAAPLREIQVSGFHPYVWVPIPFSR